MLNTEFSMRTEIKKSLKTIISYLFSHFDPSSLMNKISISQSNYYALSMNIHFVFRIIQGILRLQTHVVEACKNFSQSNMGEGAASPGSFGRTNC